MRRALGRADDEVFLFALTRVEGADRWLPANRRDGSWVVSARVFDVALAAFSFLFLFLFLSGSARARRRTGSTRGRK